MSGTAVFDTGRGDPARPVALAALGLGVVLAAGVGALVWARSGPLPAAVVALALLSIGMFSQRVARSAFAREATRVEAGPDGVELVVAGRRRTVARADLRRVDVVHVVTRDRDTGRETRVTKVRVGVAGGRDVETLPGPHDPDLAARLGAALGAGVEVREDERVFSVGDRG